MDVDERIKLARTAQGEQLWKLVRDPHPEVLSNVLLNRNLTEAMAVFIAKKKSISPEALGLIAGDIRFKDSIKLKLAICRNPKTPQKVMLSLLKFLRIFDLGDMTRDHNIPVNIKQKIEHSLIEKIPALPSGNKIALAKRANTAVVTALMEKGDRKVIEACLDTPALTEGHLCRLVARPLTKPLVVRMIAEHPKWSLRYNLKYALIRNFHTPMSRVSVFIPKMKTSDLKELYSDRNLPTATKPFIYRELLDRNETVNIAEEETFEISEDEED